MRLAGAAVGQRGEDRDRDRRHRWRLITRSVRGMANVLSKCPACRRRRASRWARSTINRSGRNSRGRAGDGRRRADVLEGEDKSKGYPGRGRTLLGARSEPQRHAGDDRRHRHREDGGLQGQARRHRLAGQRHRGDGVAAPGSRPMVLDKDKETTAIGPASPNFGQRAQATARSTCSSWVGGSPTRRRHRSRRHANVEDQLIDHSDIVDKMNANTTTSTRPERSRETYPGQDKDNAVDGDSEHPGRQRQDDYKDGPRHRQDLHREAATAVAVARRGESSITLENYQFPPKSSRIRRYPAR